MGYPNTSNFVKNTPPHVVFSILFSVFWYPDETLSLVFYSGAPAARRAANWSPISIPYMEIKGNLWVDFLMVIVASGIARGRVRTTATVESRNMAAILLDRDMQPWFTCVLLWYWTSKLWSIDLSKQGIRWPVSRYHIAGSSLQLIEVKCFFEVDRWPSSGFRLDRWLMSS